MPSLWRHKPRTQANSRPPYAAYGAGMAIEDGYFLAKELNGIDAFDTDALSAALQRFEDFRKEHTTAVKEQAYFTGKIFHHIPAFLRPLRDQGCLFEPDRGVRDR